MRILGVSLISAGAVIAFASTFFLGGILHQMIASSQRNAEELVKRQNFWTGGIILGIAICVGGVALLLYYGFS